MLKLLGQIVMSVTVTAFFFCGAFVAIKGAVTDEPFNLIAGSVAIWVAWKVS